MKSIVKIEKAEKEDYSRLIEIWEASVRTSHHFLTNADIEFYRERILNRYFDLVQLFSLKIDQGIIAGLLGLSPGKIEMLFIDPLHFRKGYGAMLVQFAVNGHAVTEVDVNEDNTAALAFYQTQGFRVVGRLEKDGEGRNFPILQLAR